MTEADDDFPIGDACTNIGLRLCGALVALLDFERDLVGAPVFRTAERANRARDAGVHVRPGARNDPRRER